MKKVFFAVLIFSMSIWGAHAFQLDWDKVEWTNGNSSQTFRNVDGSGVDIQITLSISSGNWSTSNSIDGGQKQPGDSNYYDGNKGHNQGEESLTLYPDFLNNNHENSYVDVVIRFSTPQRNVSFDLFDVDRGSYNYNNRGWEFEDVIENIDAAYQGQKVVSHNVDSGSGIRVDKNSDSGDTLYRGNKQSSDESSSVVGISWSGELIDQVSFRYSSGSRARSNPDDQAIGLSDINFNNLKPVPEANTVMMGGLIGAFAIVLGYRKRKSALSSKEQ